MPQLKPAERRFRFYTQHKKKQFHSPRFKKIAENTIADPEVSHVSTNPKQKEVPITPAPPVPSFWKSTPRKMVKETDTGGPPPNMHFKIFDNSYGISGGYRSVTNQGGCNVSDTEAADSYEQLGPIILSGCGYKIYARENTSTNITDDLLCVQSKLESDNKGLCIFGEIVAYAMLAGFGILGLTGGYYCLRKCCKKLDALINPSNLDIQNHKGYEYRQF